MVHSILNSEFRILSFFSRLPVMVKDILGVEIHRDLWYNDSMSDFHEKLVEIYGQFKPLREQTLKVADICNLHWDELTTVLNMAIGQLRPEKGKLTPEDAAMVASFRELRPKVGVALAMESPRVDVEVDSLLRSTALDIGARVDDVMQEYEALGDPERLVALCKEADVQMNLANQTLSMDVLYETDWSVPRNMLRILFCRVRRNHPLDDRLITWIKDTRTLLSCCREYLKDEMKKMLDILEHKYSDIETDKQEALELQKDPAKIDQLRMLLVRIEGEERDFATDCQNHEGLVILADDIQSSLSLIEQITVYVLELKT